jgi:NAD(P)-dependent dehydrogenase (short-subunit alcohol dehydrogenase family)
MKLNPMDLTGKRILVTGASSGIGRVTAQILSQLGAKVILMARNEERLQLALASLAGEGHAKCIFDLTIADEIPAMMKKLAQDHGPFTGLFHAAGIGVIMPVSILKEKYIARVLDVSIKAALMLTRGICQKRVFAPEACSIVFMSSAASLRGKIGMSIYSASKAAIDGAVRSLAAELAGRHIRVNSLAAGGVQTEMHHGIVKNLDEASTSDYRQKHLLGFGSPEDIAYAAAFLLSDASKWITGTTMIVDGGYCCA